MSPDEAEDAIEPAEEAGDVAKLLDIISASTKFGGNPEEDEAAEEWETPAESALDAFYRLVKGSNNATPPPPPSSLVILWGNLEAWLSCEAIVEVCLGCIVAVTNSTTAGSVIKDHQTGVEGLDVSLVRTVMQNFRSESTIQEQACLAIEGMANMSEVLKKKLVEVEDIVEELEGARDRISNERNKKYPGQALDALGLGKK